LAWWRSEKDSGQSDALNKGFKQAKGRFLTRLNADDILLPWADVEKVGCGYWVDVSVEGIADGLSRMMRLSDEERRTMDAQGKAWVQQDFNWENIAQRMLAAYRT